MHISPQFLLTIFYLTRIPCLSDISILLLEMCCFKTRHKPQKGKIRAFMKIIRCNLSKTVAKLFQLYQREDLIL